MSGAFKIGGPAPAPFAWAQFAWITAGAVALFATLRLLPTGTNLSHMDFRVDAKGTSAIEFCDPLNPQFIPVVAARSPVEMIIEMAPPKVARATVKAVVRLRTASGKPIVPEDLLVTHTRRLHLLIVDAGLGDYQHVHPEPAKTPGEWVFGFSPIYGGVYRFFADFTPAATGRGLYASADFDVGHPEGEVQRRALPREPKVETEDGRFTLTTVPTPARAKQPIDLRLVITRRDGATVLLQPVMGALAHLVAFDLARTGFAHLHPVDADPAKAPDPKRPELNFKLTIPQSGHYVVWAQVNLTGREEFVPFPLKVVE